ncbi:DNA/RNA helicase, superfamily II [Methanosarcinales archaeon]|nr:MAG: DNA/RNA helicase, superfamily II [Methanosarcinales archaeon]
MNSILSKVVDNYASVIDGEKEGAVREIFEHYAVKSIKNQTDFGLRIDIGTGFLFFSGFKESYSIFNDLTSNGTLKNIVDDEKWGSKAPIRVVMGRETSKFTKEILLSIIRDDIGNFNDETVKLLESLVKNNLIEFRVFLDRKFHVKIYNFYLRSSIPDDIWSGSANFTKAGLTDNVELCIPMQTTSETQELFRDWFDALWGMSSKDLNLLTIIKNVKESKYIYLHPMNFFAKLIHLLNKGYLLEDEVEGGENILLEFQNLSYYIVMERLQKYGGYILANSVGLGKSYVAGQAMKAYLKQNRDKKCLLIYPPRMETEWKGYLEEFGISDKVDMISMGILQKPPYGEADEGVFDHRTYTDKYSLIVADEAHHYRNENNRRKNIQNLIKSNEKAEVLLLTATPVNLSSKDLFSLIDLFYQGENVTRFETQGLRELYDVTRRGLKDSKYELNKDLLEKIKRIEKELNLKITWRIVQDHFKEDLWKLSGEKLKYEEPDTKEVSFTYPDEYKIRIFDKIADFLKELNYEPAKLWDGQGYKDDKNLQFWYKWQLYKRLESSLYAFYKSVYYLKIRFALYRESLEKGTWIDGDNLDILPFELGKQEYRNVIDETRHRVIFDSFHEQDSSIQEQILANHSSDLALIDGMLDTLKEVFGELEEIPYKDDEKIQILKKILQGNLRGGKPTIVFSQYMDTIDYLYKSLNCDIEKIDYIHGGSDKSKDKLIERFQWGDVDIILTTDILSEGVNIPRAVSIINFDLPYNPVLLVQRAGRALRITNPKKLLIYNFKPEAEIDKELDLYEKLNLRLKTILDIVGLDFIVWLMDEKDIKEIHEEEKKQYLEKFGEYKERLATTDPDKLFSATLPDESKLDKVLRKAILRHHITEDVLEVISPEINKPIYTVLNDEDDLFLIGKTGSRIKTINEVRESLEYVPEDARRLTSADYSKIESLITSANVEIEKERTSSSMIGRKSKKILNNIREAKVKLESQDMRDCLDRVRELVEKQALMKDEFDKVEKVVEDIISHPSIFKESVDDSIRSTEDWNEFTEISRKSLSVAGIELKAFIKYTGG